MSDNMLKLIPISPIYMPDEGLIQKALVSVKSLFVSANEIIIKQTDSPQFIDQGENFERIICPKCSETINNEWWQEAMDKAYSGSYVELNVIVPCCNSVVSLNELKYEWPAGFACFIIQILNPNRDLSDEELHNIEIVLGVGLRKIWTRY